MISSIAALTDSSTSTGCDASAPVSSGSGSHGPTVLGHVLGIGIGIGIGIGHAPQQPVGHTEDRGLAPLPFDCERVLPLAALLRAGGRRHEAGGFCDRRRRGNPAPALISFMTPVPSDIGAPRMDGASAFHRAGHRVPGAASVRP
ncbi:hypothetical protein GCM10010300_08010 [Streptomyces olivaceoviridis]|nr:hypothetical protein GCM10010300_08010 [Streptomyces olivaceoviridis]